MVTIMRYCFLKGLHQGQHWLLAVTSCWWLSSAKGQLSQGWHPVLYAQLLTLSLHPLQP